MKSSRRIYRAAEERITELCMRYMEQNVQITLHCEHYTSGYQLSCRIKPPRGQLVVVSSKDQASFQAALEQICGRLRQRLTKRKWKKNSKVQEKASVRSLHRQQHGLGESEADSIDAEAVLQYEELFGRLRSA